MVPETARVWIAFNTASQRHNLADYQKSVFELFTDHRCRAFAYVVLVSLVVFVVDELLEWSF